MPKGRKKITTFEDDELVGNGSSFLMFSAFSSYSSAINLSLQNLTTSSPELNTPIVSTLNEQRNQKSAASLNSLATTARQLPISSLKKASKIHSRPRTVSFDEKLHYHSTYSSEQYDRTEASVTFL